MSAWVIVLAGIIIWLLGQRVPPPKNPASLRLGWFICVLGAGVFATGVYSGVKGPVRFNGVTVNSFSLVRSAQKSHMEALQYARSELQISSRPTAGWHGSSKTDLTCTVVNRGKRSITSLTFSFVTADQKNINVKVRGPYPANAEKSVLVPLPENVNRSYFQTGMSSAQISGASF